MPSSMYFSHAFEEVEAQNPRQQPQQLPPQQQRDEVLQPQQQKMPQPKHGQQQADPRLDNRQLAPWPAGNAPNPEEGDDDPEDEDEEEEDDASKAAQPVVGKKRKQELHRRHSKRYRDNLGELFQNLEQLLPKVVPGCKLKTKSQIIANSVQAVKRLRAEVSSLEMQYVLSSPANRTKWVEDTVQKATCFQEVAEPFMRLLVGIQRWKHSELWSRYELNTLEDGQDTGTPVMNPTNTVHDLGPASSKKFFLKLERTASAQDVTATAVPEAYKMFSQISQMVTFVAGDDSLVGRISTSLSPEWIDLQNPESCRGFKRVESARQCGFSVCFAVPFLVRGHVFATILFYDNQQRPDVGPDIDIAQDLASCLGNCYGASSVQQAEETAKPGR